MTSKAFSVASVDTLSATLANHQTPDFQPTLAIILASPVHDLSAILQVFDDLSIDFVGCTTAGEIANGMLSRESISVLLMDLNRDFYRISLESSGSTKMNTGGGIFQAASRVRATADATFENPAIIAMTAGILNDGDAIVNGLKNSENKLEIPIFGGMSGDDLMIRETTIFTNVGICVDGVLALILNHDRVEVRGLATSGWQPLGSPMTITKAEGNVIYEINNHPALDFFIKFFGYYEDAKISEKPLSTMSAQYPLQIEKNGSWVMRSPIKGDEVERSVRVMASVQAGDRFRFSTSPGFEVVEDTVAAFKDFHETVSQADALLMFSCVGRHAALGPFIEDEIKGIYNHWERPMIGFLTYGEFGNLQNGICEFHNETCSLVLLKEK
ncbi:MAG: hypothetical protein RL757_884 [Bacteroidota bacterium]|jgi:hypothetical protein